VLAPRPKLYNFSVEFLNTPFWVVFPIFSPSHCGPWGGFPGFLVGVGGGGGEPSGVFCKPQLPPVFFFNDKHTTPLTPPLDWGGFFHYW